jgi:adenylate cyclase
VTLSDESFASGGLPATPLLPRSYYAKVVTELARGGAKIIALDIRFAEDRQFDDQLADAARSQAKVVWASVVQTDSFDGTQRLVLPNARLLQASRHHGQIMLPQDPERPAADRVEAVRVLDKQRIPALSVEVAMLFLGQDNRPIRRNSAGWRIGSLTIPIDRDGFFRIAYMGGPEQVFTAVPLERVSRGISDDVFLRDFFRGKVVLIGDTTTATADRFYTPAGYMAGVEIHANAIATILERQFIQEAPTWSNTLAIVLLSALVCLVTAVWGLPRAAMATGALLAAYLLGNVWLLSDRHIWLHLVAPVSSALLITMVVIGERALTEGLEKERMRWLLHRYVSPEIAEYILANKEAWAPGGKRVTATVLFADIRGFTALSEKLPPEAVVERLNEYLKAMTAIAFQHNGTVDKYVGDAIMVLFGIPVEYPDHAYRAVESAIDMQSALMSLQERWAAEGLPDMNIGIGINTGEMVAGNIGSADRLEYTVVGDAVNIAAHTEGLNKELGTRILITQATYELVKDHVLTRGPLVGKAKGKSITVYDVVGRIEHLGGESPPAHQT